MFSIAQRTEIEALICELSKIRLDMVNRANRPLQSPALCCPSYQESARNLLHYLSFRSHDHRPLQKRLAHLGLSSLGRAESHVLASVDAVLTILHQLLERSWRPAVDEPTSLDFMAGPRLLSEHTEALLGPSPWQRDTRIMVTMPSEAAVDYRLVYDLLRHGMDCMRINCAHDDATAWTGMVNNLRRAKKAVGRSCRILMDLGGPKLRTGPIESAPSVLKWRPQRDEFGRVIAPARIWLVAQERPVSPLSAADAILPVPGDWLVRLKVGDLVTFTDARGAGRTLVIVQMTSQGCWGETRQTAYVTPSTMFYHRFVSEPRVDDSKGVTIGELRQYEKAIFLRQREVLLLTRGTAPGGMAIVDSAGEVQTPARVSCTLPDVLNDVRIGERVWLDDGSIGGVIEKIDEDAVQVRIVRTRPNGEKLRSDKGINFPDSTIHLSALTEKDIADLDFVVRHADMVGLSFANSAEDVAMLDAHLAHLGDRRPGIILKIETRRGFEQLPAMLFAAMKTPRVGVMIARGDLAVECGYERLAEVQEEILWICEAAHVPVIWATQVLENLAKEGIPSRAEITDAAMGDRAECVMLNKGPHIVQAVQVLDDILQRMQAHQNKKQSMLRELHLARALGE